MTKTENQQLLSKLKNTLYTTHWEILDNLTLWITSFQFSKISQLKCPFFIILTPGSLHLLEICLRFIPPHIDIVLIENGLDHFERDWVSQNLKKHPSISLKKIGNHLIEHGKILDLIFDHYQKPFGIIDYDCFVFNPDLFKTIQEVQLDAMINAVFLRAQGIVDIPGTFFMFFNAPLINQIKEKYGIDSRIIKYDQMSKKVKHRLAPIGFTEGIYPQKGMSQFDTLMLILALGIAEGLKCNYLLRIPGSPSLDSDVFDVFHVSTTTVRSISFLQNPSNERRRLRGSYFWYRVLEVRQDDSLKNYYKEKYGNLSPAEILDKVPGSRSKLGEDFFFAVERVINQIS